VIELIKITVSLFPVFFFLLVLILLDSFKIVKVRSVIVALVVGSIAALLSLIINTRMLNIIQFEIQIYSRYIAPLIEEALKGLFIVYLIKSKKIGFMVDAAIFGFAIGAGFAFVENVYYLQTLQSSNILIWIIRGFGTAVMHGGTTAIFAIMTKALMDRYSSEVFYFFIPSLLVAIFVHSFFNHFVLPPVMMTLAQLVLLPVLITIIFKQSEKVLREWLEIGFESDVWLLEYINTGNLSETKIGRYLHSLKDKFSGEIVADMLCLLRLHLELAVRAKGILLMKEAGFKSQVDPELKQKFAELKYLEKSIGKTGKLALSPILHTTSQDLWQMYLLDK
jgi:RsiW-degrading membrane proteinase PrsW (M82 family)